MLQQIGKIVSRARKRLRIDLDRLAKDASVDRERLSRLERGEPGITTTEMARVAEQLELDGTDLLLGKEVRRPSPSIFLLHKGGYQDFDFDLSNLLDRALRAGRQLRALNAALGATPAPRLWSKQDRSPPRPDAARHGYDLANRLRSALDTKTAPLPDLGALVEERLEIAIVIASLPALNTAIGVRDDAGAAIVLSANDPQRSANPVLDRVYLAHELCHILHDPSDGGLHIVIEHANDAHPIALEQRAKGFAAEFLIPLLGLNDLLGPPRGLATEADAKQLVSHARDHFSTPWEIAANHLNHHGYISDDARTIVLHCPHPPPNSPVATRLPVPGEPSIALAERVRRAHRDGRITDGQTRMALGLTGDHALPWIWGRGR